MMPTLLEAALVERLADRADAAVHHVGRRDDVGAGRGVRQRRAHQLLDGGVVDDLIVDQMPQWPCDGVLAQADVGHDQQVRASRA